MKRHSPDDDLLRRYLLCRLTPESRETVEQRLWSDDRIFWEHLCLVEEELVDDYARGELEGDEKESFERDYLVSDERRAKLEFAGALRAHVAQEQPKPSLVWNWLRGPVATPGWAVAVAATLVLAVSGTIWQLAAGRGPGGEVYAMLSSGLVRDVSGELVRVRIPAGCQLARLQLEPGPREYDSYSATLYEVTGDEVEIWSQQRLTGGTFQGKVTVTLTLPCELLPGGDYCVRLQGVSPGREPVPLGRYDFRVLRP